MTTLLIDGDMLAYRNAAALEQGTVIDWGDNVVSDIDNSAYGFARMDKFIKSLEVKFDAATTVVCLSVTREQQFRRALLPAYKADRKDKHEPRHLLRFAKYLLDKYEAVQCPGLEADDVMGIWQTGSVPGHTIIVTIDKDLNQIPGLHYNPHIKTGKPKVIDITQQEADLNFFKQTLTGDVIDGYKGCRGIGPAKAAKLLAGKKCTADMWKSVVEMFIKQGMTEEDARVNARCARILRCGEWNVDKGVKLWDSEMWLATAPDQPNYIPQSSTT